MPWLGTHGLEGLFFWQQSNYILLVCCIVWELAHALWCSMIICWFWMSCAITFMITSGWFGCIVLIFFPFQPLSGSSCLWLNSSSRIYILFHNASAMWWNGSLSLYDPFKMRTMIVFCLIQKTLQHCKNPAHLYLFWTSKVLKHALFLYCVYPLGRYRKPLVACTLVFFRNA